MKTIENTVEIDGKHYLAQKKIWDECDSEQRVEYSFDRGETWHPLMVEAFMAAEKSGKLMRVGEAVSQAGEYEAFVISLLEEVSSMENGEVLKLVKMDEKIVVLKEKAVLAVRVSTIQEVDLTAQEG